MKNNPIILITGTRKGIGRFLVDYYLGKNHFVIGCSREPLHLPSKQYEHFCLDVADELAVKHLFLSIRQKHGRLDALINNAGIATMNHCLLTPLNQVSRILQTNCLGTFLFCREAAKIMMRHQQGRIINFTTVATALSLEGESVYAASKAAIYSLTKTLAKELAPFHITVNAIGPTPVATDLIKNVPSEKIQALLQHQAWPQLAEYTDISNVIDFYLKKESHFITAQNIYLGGIS